VQSVDEVGYTQEEWEAARPTLRTKLEAECGEYLRKKQPGMTLDDVIDNSEVLAKLAEVRSNSAACCAQACR
jgi:hypothetical protein